MWESDPRTAGSRGAPERTDRPTSDDASGARPGGRSLPWTDKPDGEKAKSAGARWGRGRGKPAGSPADASDDRADEQRDPYEVAREICLRLLAVRPRTRAELATALKKRGVAAEVSRDILERYAEVGMIDDTAFAKAWVTTRHHSKGLAGRALAHELRRRGVDDQAVTEALTELDSETEAQTALELAIRKLRSTHGEPEAVFRRLLGMLARKGYSGGVAVRAVKEALSTRDAELAEAIDPDVYEE